MGFLKVSRETRRWTSVTEIRYSVHKTFDALVGRITLPPEIVEELGWQPRQTLDVLLGEGDDAGWFALSPSEETNHRAKLKVEKNGVGRYTSKTLVPDAITEPERTLTPMSRIEGDTLYLQLA